MQDDQGDGKCSNQMSALGNGIASQGMKIGRRFYGGILFWHWLDQRGGGNTRILEDTDSEAAALWEMIIRIAAPCTSKKEKKN